MKSGPARFANRATPVALVLLFVANALAFVDPPIPKQAKLRLQPGTDITAFESKYDVTELRRIPGRDIYLVQIPDNENDEAFVEFLNKNAPEVKWAEINYVGGAPEASGKGRQFYFNQTGNDLTRKLQNAWSQINLADGLNIATGGGTSLGIIDTGVNTAHPAFGNTTFGTGLNVRTNTTDTNDVANGVDDDNDGVADNLFGHGTFMAGIASFVAPDTTIIPFVALDDEGHSDNFYVAQAIAAAIDAGCDVVSISIGSTYDSEAVRDMLIEARSKGVIIVASAGNQNTTTPEFPALNGGVVGVCAVDANDKKAAFSNYNTLVGISAPGVEIYSTLATDDFAAWDGSSMSTPMVAGAAALILSAHPDWPKNQYRVGQVEAFLRQGATYIDALNPGYEGTLGAGRLDVFGALSKTVAFDPPVDYGVGASPQNVCIADFNGDGYSDLATANHAGNNVTVRLNLGDGLFGEGKTYSANATPIAIVAADVDGNGALDLLVANDTGNRFSILPGNGDGSFQSPAAVTSGTTVVSIAVADFDDDKDIDVAVLCTDSEQVRTYKNDGNGKFTESAKLTIGRDGSQVIAADYDGDGDIDLLASCRKADAIYRFRNGGSSFTANGTISAGEPLGIAAGDLDGDGDLDLLVCSRTTNSIDSYRNSGGTFTYVSSTSMPGGVRPETVIIADFNCDGALDASATSDDEAGSVLAVFENRGGLSFSALFDLPVGAGVRCVAAGDFDRDGDSDLTAVSSGTATISTYRNQSCAAPLPGDTDCDGAVTFNDIDSFVLALTDWERYRKDFASCNQYNADSDGDGNVNFNDIDAFVEILSR